MLKVEISDTPHKLQTGLMYRNSLPDDEGMIFKFKYPQKLKFWGLNTYIPLDIAFIDKDNKIIKISHIKPLSTQTTSSNTDCVMAIEVNYGYFANNEIKEGQTVEFEKITDNIGIISFQK